MTARRRFAAIRRPDVVGAQSLANSYNFLNVFSRHRSTIPAVSTRTGAVDRPDETEIGSDVVANARITGTFGAVIFVLLFLEGVTVLRVRALISTHVFVGMLLVPLVVVKLASTGYRFVRYYRGHPGYVDKGPPPLLLRLLGPVVVATTIALLATGIGAILADRRTTWFVRAHKVSFVLWFGAMTIHVLGHALETPALATADLRLAARRRTPGGAARLALLVVTLVVGLGLGVVSLGWAHHWQGLHTH